MIYKIIRKFYKKETGKGTFTSSSSYWEARYETGRNSGSGSYGKLAEFKAKILNDFVLTNHIENVVEFGCGDGNQLKLASYPLYVGYDISKSAIEKCREIFRDDSQKKFLHVDNYQGEKYDLSLSLDVIYHLVEDEVFEKYMKMLYDSSCRYVIIYSNNYEGGSGHTKPHVRWRKFSDWVDSNKTDWKLIQIIKNIYPEESVSDFYVYKK